ncbi:MAG TPA: RluA family pseudouridine synthase [Clostridia bacterium]|nr:RluA family pseudouridine synthase [Clostridia bacterium]
MELNYKILKSDSYINVKHVLKEYFNVSDRLLLKLKNNKKIFLNDKEVFVNNVVKANDCIKVLLDFQEDNSNILPFKMNLNIIYEDDYYLVVNKEPHISIHPSMAHQNNSLSNGVKYYFDTIGLNKKIRPVNRLDKDTSGIVIFAKNEYIQECLIKQMKAGTFIKEYIGLCTGYLIGNDEVINAPIARKNDSIIERCVNINGDKSITYYSVLNNYRIDNKYISKLLYILKTGRTHQIRVHMQHIGHPILGDTLYGTETTLIKRQALHSYKTSFIHPIYKNKIEYTADLPDDMKIT